MMKAVTVNVGGAKVDCFVQYAQYGNSQIALQLIAQQSADNEAQGIFPGMPIGKPTVCLPEQSLAPNETIIKDCDEYAGFLDALEQAEIVKATGREICCGHVSYKVVEVLV
ncbi:hypothetical protein [Vibrio ichthyoenteri]|nr:hypothetical protein [Vibrio ichthyoenteri]